MADLDFGGVVRILDLRPGDTLVLEVDQPIPQQAIAEWQDELARRFPGHRCLVLSPGMTLSVVRPEKADGD